METSHYSFSSATSGKTRCTSLRSQCFASSSTPFGSAIGSPRSVSLQNRILRGPHLTKGFAFLIILLLSQFNANAAVFENVSERPGWRGDPIKWTVRVWFPDNQPVIYGLLIKCDGTGAPSLPHLRAFAMNYGFAIVGTSGDQEGAENWLFEGLDAIAKKSGHPEIAWAPFVAFGYSNGGYLSYKAACVKPDRAIAFADLLYAQPFEPPPAAFQVPGVFIGGQFDGGERTNAIHDIFTKGRINGAKWMYYTEQGTGHTNGMGNRFMEDYLFTFFDRCIQLRYPANEIPSKGPVHLDTIPEDRGSLVDLSSLRKGMVSVDFYENFLGDRDRSKTGWVPDYLCAVALRAAASYDRPLGLGITSGITQDYYRLENRVFNPGDKIHVNVDPMAAPHWDEFQLFRGITKIGEGAYLYALWKIGPVNFTDTAVPGIATYSAIGRTTAGLVHVSPPAIAFVNGGPGEPRPKIKPNDPPRITWQPRDLTATEGGKTEVIVGAQAGKNIRFSWYHDSTIIPGVSSNILQLDNIEMKDQGRYFLCVNSDGGKILSAPIQLKVTQSKGPRTFRAKQAPSIDGTAEEMWKAASVYELRNTVKGSFSKTGYEKATFRSMWDDSTLYLLYDIQDSTHTNAAPDMWGDDLIELFIEGSNKKAVSYGPTDYQFVFPRHGKGPYEWFHKVMPAGVHYAVADNQKGYTVEIAIPFSVLGRKYHSGSFAGFDTYVDFKGAGKKAFFVDTDRNWEQPGNLTSIKLVD